MISPFSLPNPENSSVKYASSSGVRGVPGMVSGSFSVALGFVVFWVGLVDSVLSVPTVVSGMLSPGDRVYCTGRFQSREYLKRLETGEEQRTAFEVSVSEICETE